ncbi:MAG: hypothetical protein H0S80_09315 [Desulfovibrionaceae bacterium]|nr:hypothetical protein [Desulfovibrionaceae bacterium]
MAVTPSELLTLALARHREPWNRTLHAASLACLCPALFLHSYLLVAAALILLGAGFFRLGLGAPPDNRWFRFTARAVEWEKNWLAAPWNWSKIWRFCFAVIAATALVWALWTGDMAALALAVGFGVLVRVAVENKKNGINP